MLKLQSRQKGQHGYRVKILSLFAIGIVLIFAMIHFDAWHYVKPSNRSLSSSQFEEISVGIIRY